MNEKAQKIDGDLSKVLKDDGIANTDIHGSIGQTIYRLSEIKQRMGQTPWVVRIIYNNYISGVLISQNPGEGNRWHYHDDCDEFWVVLEGEIKWIIEGKEAIIGKKGDVVSVPRNTKHKMVTVGDGPSIRLAVSVPDVKHFYVEEEKKK